MVIGVHGNYMDNVLRHAGLGRFVENEVAIIQPLLPVEKIVRAMRTISGHVTERLAQVGAILEQA